ncbi:hypothetical protein ACJRO7_002449 [Eucalyptus globulus]|uniref:Uncharacterized protein n=1 Tax=Eucalyptus globulus TaxID=34317 RepID=A0ABD3LUG4_EUCGL
MQEEGGGRGRSSVARRSGGGSLEFHHASERADAIRKHRAEAAARGTNWAMTPTVFRVLLGSGSTGGPILMLRELIGGELISDQGSCSEVARGRACEHEAWPASERV